MQGLADQYVYKLKILIFGSKSSGKSSLVYTYVNDNPPVSPFINQQLNFTRKKQEYLLNNAIYECRLHLWEIASRIISNKAIQAELLKQVAAYIFVYRDEVSYGIVQKSLRELKAQIWPQLDFKKIAQQPIYIILNDPGNLRSKKILQDFTDLMPNKQRVYLNQFSLHDPKAVRQFFKQVLSKVIDICSTQPIEKWVLRDRNNKVVLRDQSKKSSQFEKRYNVCC